MWNKDNKQFNGKPGLLVYPSRDGKPKKRIHSGAMEQGARFNIYIERIYQLFLLGAFIVIAIHPTIANINIPATITINIAKCP